MMMELLRGAAGDAGEQPLTGRRDWRSRVWLLLAVALAALAFWAWPQVVRAQNSAPDAACKLCHADKQGELTLASGETLSLTVALPTLENSAHGAHVEPGVYCTDCHRGGARYRYPHEPNPAKTLAEFTAEIAANCQQCHTPLELHNPGHLLAEEKAKLPNCVDCHGGHATTPAATLAADPVGTCQGCHASFADPRVGEPHAELATKLGPGQSCQTCHADQPLAADDQCKTCHSLLTSDLTLSTGDVVNLHVNPEDIVHSVHGERVIQGVQYTTLQCVDCHQDQERYGFPHPALDAGTRRDLTLKLESICQECHAEIYARTRDGVHEAAIAAGNQDAATCFDCHGNHTIQIPDEPREHISQTCAQCHATINEEYAQSIHGAALLGDHNPDVAVCTDCHGVHNIADPTTAQFRVQSPDMCADCHADKALMEKYGISTEVFETYVADFHGTTVELFEKQTPWQETNKAVCYDCHGIHNIQPVDGAHSQVIRENLLITCQKCHPDATASFPDAWTSHFKPSPEHNPLIYWVNLFYVVLIPGVVGAFVLFIGTDIYRSRWDRWRERRADERERNSAA